MRALTRSFGNKDKSVYFINQTCFEIFLTNSALTCNTIHPLSPMKTITTEKESVCHV